MGIPEWTLIGMTIFGLVMSTFGFLLRSGVSVMEKRIDKLEDFQDIVLSDYPKRNEIHDRVDKLETALFQKLDRIENKLDGKADKAHYRSNQ